MSSLLTKKQDKIMTSKEKATELFAKFHSPLFEYSDSLNYNQVTLLQKCAKQCAIIAVEEIIYNLSGLDDSVWHMNTKDYWQEVKQEIELL